MLAINKPMVIVDYQQDGSSFNMYRQYWNNPKGFMCLRRIHMQYYNTLKERIRTCTHYVAHCIRAGRKTELLNNPCPMLTMVVIIPGIFLYLLTRYKVHHQKTMNWMKSASQFFFSPLSFSMALAVRLNFSSRPLIRSLSQKRQLSFSASTRPTVCPPEPISRLTVITKGSLMFISYSIIGLSPSETNVHKKPRK